MLVPTVDDVHDDESSEDDDNGTLNKALRLITVSTENASNNLQIVSDTTFKNHPRVRKTRMRYAASHFLRLSEQKWHKLSIGLGYFNFTCSSKWRSKGVENHNKARERSYTQGHAYLWLLPMLL